MGNNIIHYADKADIEIGTAKCGVRIKGGTLHTAESGRVTCPRCDGSLAAARARDEAATPEADEPVSKTADFVREIIKMASYLYDRAEESADAEASSFWAFIASKTEEGPAAHWKAVAADEQRVQERIENKECYFAEQAEKLRDELKNASQRAEHYRVRSALLSDAICELAHTVRHDSRL